MQDFEHVGTRYEDVSARFVEAGVFGDQAWIRGDTSLGFGYSVPDENGHEAGLSGYWDWDGETLTVQSDRHGYLPLYYQHDAASGRLCVSDSPLQILAMSSDRHELDLTSLAFFCRAGFVLGNRTLYRNIHRVPAGSTLSWSRGALSITSSEKQFEGDAPRTVEEAIEGWIDRFQTAMRRRLPMSDFALPMSGGRDSRMMLLELMSMGFKPSELITHGPGTRGVNDDLRIAREFADRLDIPHKVVRSTRGWVDIELERHAWCGTEALEHSWLIPLWSYLTSHHTCWYDGIGVGALTRNSVNTPEMLSHLRNGEYRAWCEGLFAKTASPSGDWVDRIIEASPFEMPDMDEVVAYVREEVEQYQDAPNPTTRFTFCNWGRRAIALSPFGICRGAEMLHTPFMDRDLVNWVASVPAEMSFEDDLQTEACRRLYPAFADIDFNGEGSSCRSGSSVLQKVGNWVDKARFFASSGRVFQDIASDAMRKMRRDPAANDAIGLMGHLVLADACSKDADRARDLMRCAPARRVHGRRLAESVA